MGVKILFYGDSPTVPTGFGTVAKNLLPKLKALGHDIEVLGINHFGDWYDQTEFPFKIHPVDKGNEEGVFGYQKLWWIVSQVKPDLLFVLNDPWIAFKALQYMPDQFKGIKKIIYFPTDAGPIKEEWVDCLNEFNAQICYSNYAERVVIESNKGTRPKDLYQVYHGVNTDTYKPVMQALARKELGIPLDSFVVGMVARNQYRKRFDLLMQGFAKFAKDKPNAKLYLHTALHDVGYDIKDLAQQFDIQNRLILTADITPGIGVPEEFLNLIYNTFDVNALISLGDGFGLPVAESMATGCPQLVSGHSCLSELVDGHGGLTVKTAAWLLNSSGINTWGGVSDVEDITAKLNVLYNSRELRMNLSQQAFDFITQEKFTWDFAASQMNDIIKKVFHIL